MIEWSVDCLAFRDSTMTKQALLTRVAATLSTLVETNGCPESMIYLAFGGDIHEWEYLRDIMLQAGFITIKGHYVTLTEDGKIKALQINAMIAAKN